jgi:Ca2+-binding EF-hand superfamily protein
MSQNRERTRDAEKRAELREDFEYLDEDHDGRMQFDEFVNFLSGLEADMSAEECRIGFAAIDHNHDGAIEFDEFLTWWQSD